MMKEVTRNDMEMIYGGAELKTETKKTVSSQLVIAFFG